MRNCFSILCLLLLSLNAFSQSADTIRVGITHEPPFVIIGTDGTYSGLSIDLWQSIANEQKVAYQFLTYSDQLGLIRALDFKEIDICINPMHANEVRLRMLDITQPFYVSSIGVATSQVKKSRVRAFLKNFFSLRFLRVIFFLLILILTFGTLLWIAERKENRRQFRPGIIGLFDGLWWSAVTMTTVGYGDKAPKTKIGKIIAIIWMLTAIVTISGFTGAIASTLTVQSLGRTIEDLGDLQQAEMIGSVMSSSSEAFLKQQDIQPDIVYQDVQEALTALAAQNIEVLVYDKSVLDYNITTLQLSNKVVLLPVNFNQQYRSFFLPKNSPNLDWVNALLVRNINDARWQELMRKYNLQGQ